ncbi:MAG: hypothetical protein ACK5KO_12520 [Arachnia sp.]
MNPMSKVATTIVVQACCGTYLGLLAVGLGRQLSGSPRVYPVTVDVALLLSLCLAISLAVVLVGRRDESLSRAGAARRRRRCWLWGGLFLLGLSSQAVLLAAGSANPAARSLLSIAAGVAGLALIASSGQQVQRSAGPQVAPGIGQLLGWATALMCGGLLTAIVVMSVDVSGGADVGYDPAKLGVVAAMLGLGAILDGCRWRHPAHTGAGPASSRDIVLGALGGAALVLVEPRVPPAWDFAGLVLLLALVIAREGSLLTWYLFGPRVAD